MRLRLLICGDRNWSDKDAILKVINSVKDDLEVVISGGARGADTFAREACAELNVPFLEFPADWKKHGKSAGPIRNNQMLREGRPLMVIAFHDDINNSKGTKDMCRQATRAGIPVRVISHDKPPGEKP